MTTTEKLLRILKERRGQIFHGLGSDLYKISYDPHGYVARESLEEAVDAAYEDCFPVYKLQKGDIGHIRSSYAEDRIGLGVFDGTEWKWGNGADFDHDLQRPPRCIVARMLPEPIELES